jgi:hypothetical protein
MTHACGSLFSVSQTDASEGIGAFLGKRRPRWGVGGSTSGGDPTSGRAL